MGYKLVPPFTKSFDHCSFAEDIARGALRLTNLLAAFFTVMMFRRQISGLAWSEVFCRSKFTDLIGKNSLETQHLNIIFDFSFFLF